MTEYKEEDFLRHRVMTVNGVQKRDLYREYDDLPKVD